MTREELAAEVLAMFAMQQEYFKTRDTAKLHKYKSAESKLKKKCNEILNPPKQAELPGFQ